MKKNAPKILAIILLITIATLMLFAGSGSIKNLLNGTTTVASTNGGDNKTTPINEGKDNGGGKKGDNEDKGKDTDLVSRATVFPKSSIESDFYAFEQTIKIDSDIDLNAVHQTSRGIFIIVSSKDCKGDFTYEKSGVSIIRMSKDGALEAIAHLETETPSCYLTSQVTMNGIAVVVNEGNISHAFVVDASFEDIRAFEVPYVSDARIYSLLDSFIIVSQNILYLIKEQKVVKSSTIHGDILEIIDMNSYFAIFVNGINEYSILKLDKNLTLMSKSTISDCNALAIHPVYEGGELKFIVAEKTNNAVHLAKYPASFRETKDRVYLSFSSSADIYINQQTIFAIVKAGDGSNPRVYISDFDLNVIISSSTYLKDVKDIYLCQVYEEGYFILKAGKEEGLSLIDFRNNGGVSEDNLNISPETATFIYYMGKTVMVFYKNAEDSCSINIVGIKY